VELHVRFFRAANQHLHEGDASMEFGRSAYGLLLLMPLLGSGQAPDQVRLRRAAPPKIPPDEANGIFFENVFEQGVIGRRPSPARARGPEPASPLVAGPAASAPANGDRWSATISAETLEDEVKRAKIVIDQSVVSPTRFRSQDYRTCRLEFSLLAMLFGIIEEYDGQVRWKSDASKLRQALARAGANCKSGSEQAFNEARQRKADLQDIVGGGSSSLPPAKPKENWEQVCDRSPLMQRLERAEQDVLRPLTADAAGFRASAESLLHEAELVAAIGKVLQREGMMDAGDEDYDAFAERMTRSARDLVQALKQQNHEAARQAVGQISESCNACHEPYRG
jgi:cytochrome c556